MIFSKTGEDRFHIQKQASESHENYSPASLTSLSFEPKSATSEHMGAHWTYSGIEDERSNETEETLLIELQFVLANLTNEDIDLLRSLSDGALAKSQMIKGMVVTADMPIKLVLVPHISPNPAAQRAPASPSYLNGLSVWGNDAVSSLGEQGPAPSNQL